MPVETLKNFSVTPSDVAGTFLDTQKLDVWERYQRAADCYRRGLSPAEAAAEEGIFFERTDPQPYNSFRSTYHRWLPLQQGGGGELPYAVQTARDLHFLGIFPGKDGYEYEETNGLWADHLNPFTAKNPKFPAMAMMSSLRLLAGSTNNKSRRFNNPAGFYSSRAMKDPRILAFLQALTECPDHQVAPDERFTYIDALQARFMGLLGNAIGNRSELGALVTRPLQAALNTLHDKKASSEERALAQTVLHDFGLAFFGLGKARVQPRYKTHARGNIPALISKEAATERAKLFIDILTHAGLDTTEVKSYGPYKNKSAKENVFYSVVDFGFEGPAQQEIDRLREQFFIRMNQLTTTLAPNLDET